MAKGALKAFSFGKWYDVRQKLYGKRSKGFRKQEFPQILFKSLSGRGHTIRN